MEIRFPIISEWILTSAYGQEKIVLGEIAAVIARVDPSFERLEDMLTAVAEACLNAFEHGNGLDGQRPVRVRMAADELRYSFRIADEGEGFPSYVKPPGIVDWTSETDESRGWGLFFIEVLADRWSYGRSEGKFYIEIEFDR